MLKNKHELAEFKQIFEHSRKEYDEIDFEVTYDTETMKYKMQIDLNIDSRLMLIATNVIRKKIRKIKQKTEGVQNYIECIDDVEIDLRNSPDANIRTMRLGLKMQVNKMFWTIKSVVKSDDNIKLLNIDVEKAKYKIKDDKTILVAVCSGDYVRY